MYRPQRELPTRSITHLRRRIRTEGKEHVRETPVSRERRHVLLVVSVTIIYVTGDKRPLNLFKNSRRLKQKQKCKATHPRSPDLFQYVLFCFLWGGHERNRLGHSIRYQRRRISQEAGRQKHNPDKVTEMYKTARGRSRSVLAGEGHEVGPRRSAHVGSDKGRLVLHRHQVSGLGVRRRGRPRP